MVGEGHGRGEVRLGRRNEVEVAAASARHHGIGERLVDVVICGRKEIVDDSTGGLSHGITLTII